MGTLRYSIRNNLLYGGFPERWGWVWKLYIWGRIESTCVCKTPCNLDPEPKSPAGLQPLYCMKGGGEGLPTSADINTFTHKIILYFPGREEEGVYWYAVWPYMRVHFSVWRKRHNIYVVPKVLSTPNTYQSCLLESTYEVKLCTFVEKLLSSTILFKQTLLQDFLLKGSLISTTQLACTHCNEKLLKKLSPAVCVSYGLITCKQYRCRLLTKKFIAVASRPVIDHWPGCQI